MKTKVITCDEFRAAIFKRLLRRREMDRVWRLKNGGPVWWVMTGKNEVSVCTHADFAFQEEIVILRGTDVESLADAVIGWLVSLTKDRSDI